MLAAIAVPVAVVPDWVLALIAELIAVKILTCGVFVRAVRFSVLPAVDPVFEALIIASLWFIATLTKPVAVVPFSVSATNTVPVA